MPYLPHDIPSFLEQYGYSAIVLGTFLEGETVLLLAGFFAHQGYLDPAWVAVAAFCGSFSGDETMFLLARYKGVSLLRRFPRLAAGVERMGRTMRGSEIPLILGFRFVYGIRNITPAFLGVNGTSPLLFAPLNAVSAALWAVSFTAAGYFGGQALTQVFGRLHAYEPYILAGFLAIGATVWLIHRRKTKPVPPPETDETGKPER